MTSLLVHFCSAPLACFVDALDTGGRLLCRGPARRPRPRNAGGVQHRSELAPAKAGGSQFTSREFMQILRDHSVKISMDGRGRYHDNIFVERLWRTVKYEEVPPESLCQRT